MEGWDVSSLNSDQRLRFDRPSPGTSLVLEDLQGISFPLDVHFHVDARPPTRKAISERTCERLPHASSKSRVAAAAFSFHTVKKNFN